MKKAFNIIGRIVVGLIILALVMLLAIRLPKVQSWLLNRAIEVIEKNIDADISFTEIHFQPVTAFVLTGLKVQDGEKTILEAGTVYANFTLRGLTGGEGLHFSKVYLSDIDVDLVFEKGEYPVNIMRCFHIRKKEGGDQDKEGSAAFDVGRVEIRRADIRVSGIEGLQDMRWAGDLSASKLKLKDGDFYGHIGEISLSEVNGGYDIQRASADITAGKNGIAITDFIFKDLWTDASVSSLDISKGSDIRLEGLKTRLSSKSLAYFLDEKDIPSLEINASAEVLSLTGESIHARRVAIMDAQRALFASISADVENFTSIDSLSISADLHKLEMTTSGMAGFLSNLGVKGTDRISGFAKGETINASGRLGGSLKDAEGSLEILPVTRGGKIEISLVAHDIKDFSNNGHIQANIEIDNADLGNLAGLGSDAGRASAHMSTEFAMNRGIPQSGSLRIDLERVDLLQRSIKGIVADAVLDEKGNVHIESYANDSTILADLKSDIHIPLKSTETLTGKATLVLERFLWAESGASLAANMSIRRETDRLEADLDINDVILSSGNGKWDIGNLAANYRQKGTLSSFNLISSFLDAEYSGKNTPAAFFKDIAAVTYGRELEALSSNTRFSGSGYEASLHFKDTRNIFSFILPGAYLGEGTDLSLILSEEGNFKAKIQSPRLAFEDKYIRHLDLALNNEDDQLTALLEGSDINISGIPFEKPRLIAQADDGEVVLYAAFINSDEDANNADISLKGFLSRAADGNLEFKINTLPSSTSIAGQVWTIRESEILLAKNALEVKNLMIDHEQQSFSLDGMLRQNSRDTLTLALNDFDISFLNSFTGKYDFDIQSSLTGRVLLISPEQGSLPGLLVSLNSDQTSVSGYQLGSVRAAANIDTGTGKLVSVVRTSKDGKTEADLRATYSFNDKNVSASARLREFNIGCITPLLAEVFEVFDLSLSGDINAEGPLDNLDISSRGCRVENGSSLTVDFTKVRYMPQGRFHIDSNGLHFDNCSLADSWQGKGNIRGGIYWDHFKNARLGIDIEAQGAQMINLQRMDANYAGFYGEASGNGNISISGPFTDVRMKIDAATAGQGSFSLPLNNRVSKVRMNILRFTESETIREIDPYEEMMGTLIEKREKKKKGDFHLDLRVNVGNEITAHVDIDDNGNGITANGTGDIQVNVGARNGEFGLGGDYTINEGDFHFGVLGLVSRDFTLQNGGTLRFSGDPLDTDVNIDAIYSLKTSLAPILTDTSAIANRRTVNCGINITDKLRNPQLSFSVEVPDLDPSTQSAVNSALNTQDKVDKQFVGLLVTNAFLPDEQSGITSVNPTQSTLYSSVSNMMSSQINSIMQMLRIPLDLGLNYQANEGGTDIFDVALSTQLWDNRISVSGNLGNRQYNTSNTTGEMIGNLDVEFKVNKSGTFRLLLFSHAADTYTNYLDNSQRNGGGITFQKEFTSLKDYLKSLLFKKKKEEEMPGTADEEIITIRIDNDRER